MPTDRRHTVTVDLAPPDQWVVTVHHWAGNRLVGASSPRTYTTRYAALVAADDSVRHRVAAGQRCVLDLSPEAQEETYP